MSKNHFWNPQAKKFFLLFFWPPNFEKKNFFQNLGVKKIAKKFFWLVGFKNDFWTKFLSIISTRHTKSGSIWIIGTYLKNQFWGYRAVFWPFFRGRYSKITCGNHFKEVGQLQKFYQKKLGTSEHILEFSAPLCDQNSLRYLKKLLAVFFVATR